MQLVAKTWYLTAGLALGLLYSGTAARAACGTGHQSVVVGAETEVPFLADHYGVELAILDDGRFALSGTATVATGNPSPDLAQFEIETYSRLGQRLGEFVPLPAADTGSIGSLGDEYFVSWQHFAAGSTRAAVLNSEGMQLGRSMAWPNSSIEFYGHYYRYGSGPLWRFIPVIYRPDGTDPITGDTILVPQVQVYEPTGMPLGSPLRLAPANEQPTVHDLAMSGHGRFVVVFQRCAGSGATPCPTGLQVFAGAGEPLGFFATAGVPQQTLGDIAAAIQDSGQELLAWINEMADGSTRLWVRLFNFRGEPLSQPVAVVASNLALQEQVRAVDGCGFVVTWANADSDGSQSFFASLCESPALHCSAPVAIARGQQAPAGFQFEMNHQGQGLALWTTEDGPGVFTGHMATVTARVD